MMSRARSTSATTQASGSLDEAEAMLIDREPLINPGAMLECVLSAYFVMARIAAHRMNLERTRTLLDWAENQGNARGCR
jgi:LuxR family transcriptional regulator, maltose regulon positive regulatory protein